MYGLTYTERHLLGPTGIHHPHPPYHINASTHGSQFDGSSAVWLSAYNSTTEVGNITFGITTPVHIITFQRLAVQRTIDWHDLHHGAVRNQVLIAYFYNFITYFYVGLL
jgi:hypothetical protein